MAAFAAAILCAPLTACGGGEDPGPVADQSATVAETAPTHSEPAARDTTAAENPAGEHRRGAGGRPAERSTGAAIQHRGARDDDTPANRARTQEGASRRTKSTPVDADEQAERERQLREHGSTPAPPSTDPRADERSTGPDNWELYQQRHENDPAGGSAPAP